MGVESHTTAQSTVVEIGVPVTDRTGALLVMMLSEKHSSCNCTQQPAFQKVQKN